MKSQTRIIVVGAGNAALVAALAAHEAGAQVVVLEAATREERGGNSRFAGATFRFVHQGLDSIAPLLGEESHYLLELSRVDPYTVKDYLADLHEMSGGRAEIGLCRALVEDSYAMIAWMRDQGVRWELSTLKFVKPDLLSPDVPYVLPPGGAVRVAHAGIGLTDDLFAAVERAGIPIRYESPAHELIVEGSTVRGVRIRRTGVWEDVHGQVILASGGFEANPEMRLRYLGAGWDLVKVRGSRFNKGIMLDAALRAGAQAVGHWGGCHATPVAWNAPNEGDLAVTDATGRHSYPYGLIIARTGRRFVDEGERYYMETYAKTGAAIRAQPGAWAAQIFDQRTADLLQPRYRTQDPVVGETIAELADKLAVPMAALDQTVAEFNAAVPADLGRFDPAIEDGLSTTGVAPPKSNWALPLDRPPFVAYPVTAGITFTYGGIKVDVEGRVLDNESHPMPGLYATGEITGGFFFQNYPAGAGLMRGAVFGRRAARSAVAAMERGR